MRVVVADDSMIVREGLARLLADAGFAVVGKAENAQELLRRVELTSPERFTATDLPTRSATLLMPESSLAMIAVVRGS